MPNSPPLPPNWPYSAVKVWPFRMSRYGDLPGACPTCALRGAAPSTSASMATTTTAPVLPDATHRVPRFNIGLLVPEVPIGSAVPQVPAGHLGRRGDAEQGQDGRRHVAERAAPAKRPSAGAHRHQGHRVGG